MTREIELELSEGETIEVELTQPRGLTALSLLVRAPSEREAVKGELDEDYVRWVRDLLLATTDLDEAEIEALPAPVVIELIRECVKVFEKAVGAAPDDDEDFDLDGGLDLDDWR